MSESFEVKFFAASNSRNGFINYFDRCFGESSGICRLYVIKGGSGTGKSYLMRRVAKQAEDMGFLVEYYYCSSDPHSLDGVSVTFGDGKRMGVIDGTPPHVWEPRLPGAVENIINLGEFWDSRRLAECKSEINWLIKEKSAAYKKAYSYLAAAGNARDVERDFARSFLSLSKIRAVAERAVKDIVAGNGCTHTALQCALCAKGRVRFDTYARLASRVYAVEDFYGTGSLLLGEILDASKEKNCNVYVSRDPLCPDEIDGLYYPEADTAFLLCMAVDKAEGEKFHALGVRRFASVDGLRAVRADLRRAVSLREDLVAAATDSFRRASDMHFKIEEIYSSAMDFDAKDKHDSDFCKKVFEI
jgi:hypothetical protein